MTLPQEELREFQGGNGGQLDTCTEISLVGRVKEGDAKAIAAVEHLFEGRAEPAAAVDFTRLGITQMEAATGFPRQTLLRWAKGNGLARNEDSSYSLPDFVRWLLQKERNRYEGLRRVDQRKTEIRCPVCLDLIRLPPSSQGLLFRMHRKCHKAFYSLFETDPLRMAFALSSIILRFEGRGTSGVVVQAMKCVRRVAHNIVSTQDVQSRYLRLRAARGLELVSRAVDNLSMKDLAKEMIMANVELDQEDLDRAKKLFRAGSEVVIAVLRGERKYDENARLAFPAMETGQRMIAGEIERQSLEVQRQAIMAKLLLKLGDPREIKKAVAAAKSLPEARPAEESVRE